MSTAENEPISRDNLLWVRENRLGIRDLADIILRRTVNSFDHSPLQGNPVRETYWEPDGVEDPFTRYELARTDRYDWPGMDGQPRQQFKFTIKRRSPSRIKEEFIFGPSNKQIYMRDADGKYIQHYRSKYCIEKLIPYLCTAPITLPEIIGGIVMPSYTETRNEFSKMLRSDIRPAMRAARNEARIRKITRLIPGYTPDNNENG